MTDNRPIITYILLVAFTCAVSAIDSAPPDPIDSLRKAMDHLQLGRFAQAEQTALASGDRSNTPSSRAWLIVATARQQQGRYAAAIEAYTHFLDGCRSAELRQYVTSQMAMCKSRQEPVRLPIAPSGELDAKALADLGKVGPEVVIESSEHFVVRARNAKLARLLTVEAEKALSRICGDVLAGSEYAHSVDIYVWVDRQEYSAHAISAPEWAGGGFTISSEDGVMTRRIDLTQRDKQGRFDPIMLDRVLPHEMCHLVLQEYFGDTDCPLFLNEGLAMLAEPLVDNARLVLAGTVLAGKEPQPLDKLLAASRHTITDPSIFYAKALSFTQFLREKLTPGQFSGFLSHVRDGCSTDDAIQRALFTPASEEFIPLMDKAWRKHTILQGHYLRALSGGEEEKKEEKGEELTATITGK